MIEQSTTFLTRQAYAKINLALAVDRPDPESGMHPICSWMHSIALSDEITIAKSDQPSYSIRWGDGGKDDGREVEWAFEDDLAVRAHRAIEQAVGRSLDIELTIIKRIPAGGGLGGGSSDAALTIQMLDELFALEMNEQTIHNIAASLGSDIPFFLDRDSYAAQQPSRPAFVSGMGDTIERLDRRLMPITLIVPSFGCPTGDVYSALDRSERGAFEQGAVRALCDTDLGEDSALFNDLARAAELVAPELSEIRASIEQGIGRAVHVSGSGSTLFVLGATDENELRRLAPGCRVLRSSLI